MLLPVRKEAAEFYQQTMRQVQESRPTHFQEVTSATRGGRAPPLLSGRRQESEHPWNNFIPVQVSAYDVPALGGDCSYSGKDCHSSCSPYCSLAACSPCCRLAVKRLEHPWTARASPNVPGRGEAFVAINLASPWRARPSVQMRNAWHTLLLHPQSFTNVYTDGLFNAPLRHFCKQGRLGFSSNKELGIVQFL